MTKDEALRLALEALENHTVQTRPIAATDDAITAIKEALAQPEQEPQLTPSGIHKIGCVNHDCQHCKEMKDWEGIAADQAMTIALMKSEQSEQEPVGHIYTIAGVQHCTIEQVLPDGPLYTNHPPCPTCEALSRTVMLDQTSHDRHKREWVGLSHDETYELIHYVTDDAWGLVKSVEAKLKELNA